MSRNPFVNAALAAAYIAVVASLMYYVPKAVGLVDSVFVPIAVLSLFVLSAALMGYFFLFQPVQMYLDGQKKEAIDLFVKTVGVFAGITILIFAILFFSSI
ncbi:hypothetical protein A3A38_03705 [Candidatus Kaiserbacteria bacterium RIFCSPLOWO2_01_FULL_53_17]|uniref:DUF5671 domain-containing protein n=1 Tax=Candidatus Kaiserbacteria bacterium RIFCSPLOWO2_01_FULL_53_17 TaxID=1798511 RepID=A0A1F6EGG3_9BACT|nr:MAG: hypothetical protein A3A38_03705 [Candidatus Kaiserbacteria bacterium RIFCSPLOWO2_01_FULL_53_17]